MNALRSLMAKPATDPTRLSKQTATPEVHALDNGVPDPTRLSDHASTTEVHTHDDGADEQTTLCLDLSATAADVRRTQAKMFDDWVRDELPSLKEKDVSEARETRSATFETSKVDHTQPIQSLLGASERREIINSPRDYQIELFERAKADNLIAVLDTGTGKTLIAILLLRWTVDQELERRAAGQARKISFFLTTSVNLAMQQYAVLQANLPHATKLLYGDLNVDSWSRQDWQDMLDEHRIVVCTAEVLNQALGRGHVKIKEISLMVFDEAHHAKKDHPYAVIIKDHYLRESDASRPRIFGMTASPVDAKDDIAGAANMLEVLLASRIVTAGELTSLQSLKRPAEHVLSYSTHCRPYNSALVQHLRANFAHLAQLNSELARAERIAGHLGEWCADQYLLGLTSLHRKLTFQNAVRNACSRQTADDHHVDNTIRKYDDLFAYIETTPLREQAINAGNVSDKLAKLANALHIEFKETNDHRCLVFVDEKITAYLLSLFFEKINMPNLRASYLTGSGQAFSDNARCTIRDQSLTLLKFRTAELNCVFSTSVGEEGLDIPDCNLVIRFDMYRSMIQYIQSRGRARRHPSKFIHMNENGNSRHVQMTQDVRKQELQMRQFCQTLPKDRRLLVEDNDDVLSTETAKRSFIEPETGARLTDNNALVFLANFVSAMPTDADEPEDPAYSYTAVGNQWKSEVVLPAGAPIGSIISKPCARKALAQRWAAFDACVELRKSGHLDAHFKPTYERKARAKQAHRLAEGLNKQEKYSMITKPRLWTDSRGSLPQELWLTRFDFDKGLDLPHTPIVLLTRQQLPDIPAIPIFRNDGQQTQAVSRQSENPVSVTTTEVEQLAAFTLRVFRDIFSKTYDNTAQDLSYFLAPASSSAANGISGIDWTVLVSTCTNDIWRWAPGDPVESLLGRMLLDPIDGSRKFLLQTINKSLKATDPLPKDSIKCVVSTTILDGSYSMRPRFRDTSSFDTSQPVYNAEMLKLRRNMLIPATEKEITANSKAYVCPEPLEVSTIPISLVVSFLTWPSIIWRLESVLIAQEACSALGLVCDPKLALAAFTKDSDDSVDHGNVELVNFRQGMGENYERLEFLGDTFLKMATTISTYVQNVEDNEESLHIKRMFMLCNRNLFNVATELELYKYIRSQAFQRRFWYPEGLQLVKGKGTGTAADRADIYETQTHSLSVKTIADVSEALIGAAYLTYNKIDQWSAEDWTMPVRSVTKLVGNEDHLMTDWTQYEAAYQMPAYYSRRSTASERDMVEMAKTMHHYAFKSATLLRSAFLHPSQARELEQLPSYQSLEFLGDALLDMAIISHIFYTFPTQDPHWLTETKTVMVANRFLGALACKLGFHKLLRHHSAILQAQITTYASELEQARDTANGARDYWVHVTEPPKCLADTVESYVGAMFIDSGFDFGQVLRFFNEHIKWFFEDMSVYAEYTQGSPISSLAHLVQKKFQCRGLRTMTKEVPVTERADRREVVVGVMVHNLVVAYSTGVSGRYAGDRASKQALAALSGLQEDEFRAAYSCRCSNTQ